MPRSRCHVFVQKRKSEYPFLLERSHSSALERAKNGGLQKCGVNGGQLSTKTDKILNGAA